MNGLTAYICYGILKAYSKFSKPIEYKDKPRIAHTVRPSEKVSFIEYQKNIFNQNRIKK